jgi:ectoine hydroxylase-related dioxygenase (phytanoyl-CoA dioxygenase family)
VRYRSYVKPMQNVALSGYDGALGSTAEARFSARAPGWFLPALASLQRDGFAIVEDVVPAGLLKRTREAIERVRDATREPRAPQDRTGTRVLRLVLRHDARFYELLELDDVLAVVDACLCSTAVLQLQNVVIAPPVAGPRRERTTTTFRRDFPHHLNGYVASITTLLAIDDFTQDNGAPLLVPGSHQRPDAPDPAQGVPALCRAGAMVVLDSTLWHAPGTNRSSRQRVSVTQQFSRSFVQPQVDYVRALGEEIVQRRSQRTQQLLGRYTRAIASVDEDHRPAYERMLDGWW